MEILNDIIQTTLSSFDFAFCIIINLLTYFINIILIDIRKGKELSKWIKRLVMSITILSTGVVYSIIGQDIRLILNSAILAPVSWSFIFKPICKKLNIDYTNKEK